MDSENQITKLGITTVGWLDDKAGMIVTYLLYAVILNQFTQLYSALTFENQSTLSV